MVARVCDDRNGWLDRLIRLNSGFSWKMVVLALTFLTKMVGGVGHQSASSRSSCSSSSSGSGSSATTATRTTSSSKLDPN
ncbi:unnamed protein product, partial [Amoebophrya sp. A25]|eukprot:GSA25T00026056001.1